MARQNTEPTEAPEEQDSVEVDTPVLYYDAGKNPTGGFFTGVPQRDLTQTDLDARPKWLQKSVAAAPFYSKDAPAPAAEADADAPDQALPEIGGTSDAEQAQMEAN
jgi:hypothetical protein